MDPQRRGHVMAATVSDKPAMSYSSREAVLPPTPSGARLEAHPPANWLWLFLLITALVAAFLLLTGI